jgi:hypothetical protein
VFSCKPETVGAPLTGGSPSTTVALIGSTFTTAIGGGTGGDRFTTVVPTGGHGELGALGGVGATNDSQAGGGTPTVIHTSGISSGGAVGGASLVTTTSSGGAVGGASLVTTTSSGGAVGGASLATTTSSGGAVGGASLATTTSKASCRLNQFPLNKCDVR